MILNFILEFHYFILNYQVADEKMCTLNRIQAGYNKITSKNYKLKKILKKKW